MISFILLFILYLVIGVISLAVLNIALEGELMDECFDDDGIDTESTGPVICAILFWPILAGMGILYALGVGAVYAAKYACDVALDVYEQATKEKE
jgi:hypothetical protein